MVKGSWVHYPQWLDVCEGWLLGGKEWNSSGIDSLFAFQLRSDWLHLLETHSPEIPATDHRHACCTTFSRSRHHQRGKVRHLPTSTCFLSNQPFSWWVLLLSTKVLILDWACLPFCLRIPNPHALRKGPRTVFLFFPPSVSVYWVIPNQRASMSEVKPAGGCTLHLTRHMSCQPGLGFPVHS